MLSSRAAHKVNKAEVKYNVVTEYPDLRLHSAAANGNIALVHYALTHGQPVNSVLEGLLPLHAAASNGSEIVVTRLIDAGADVNAPRLPLRYNNEKAKNGSVIVGTSGCTPLHFAAANGHLSIVRLLLARGADPLRADKHGVRPEDIAADYGYTAIVECLREASDSFSSHDGDNLASTSASPSANRLPPPASSSQQSMSSGRSRILRVQRSIGDTLSGSARRPSLTNNNRARDDSSASESQSANVNLPVQILGPGTTMSHDPNASSAHQPGRRPSLPTLLELSPPMAKGAPPARPVRHKRPSSAGEGSAGSKSPERPIRLRGDPTKLRYPERDPTIPIPPGLRARKESRESGKSSIDKERVEDAMALLGLPASHGSAKSENGSIRKAPSKYSIANIFKKSESSSPTLDNLHPPRASSESNVTSGRASGSPSPAPSSSRAKRDANAVLAKTLDEMFSAPVLPVKSTSSSSKQSPSSSPKQSLSSITPSTSAGGSTPWYRSRKSSEVVVSSPLAVQPSTTARDVTSQSSTEGSGEGDHESRTTRARSTSAPVLEDISPPPAERHRRRPSALSQQPAVGSMTEMEGEADSESTRAPPPSAPANMTSDRARPSSPPLPRSMSDPTYPVSITAALLPPESPLPPTPRTARPPTFASASGHLTPDAPLLAPERSRGNSLAIDPDPTRQRGGSFLSLSSDTNSGVSSNGSASTVATTSTVNTSMTPPSPTTLITPHPQSARPTGAFSSSSPLLYTSTTPTEGVAPRKRPSPKVPLPLQGVTSIAEAKALVQRARDQILASASDPPSPGMPADGKTLAEQLELYGRTLELERHFAKGEAQKHKHSHSKGMKSLGSRDVLGVGSSGDEEYGVVRYGEDEFKPGSGSSSSSSGLTASPLGVLPAPVSASSRLEGSAPGWPHDSRTVRTPKATVSRSVSAPFAHPQQRPPRILTTSPPRPKPAAANDKRKHRPIANMSYLQHKHSLEARLNRKYQAGNDGLSVEDDELVGEEEEDEEDDQGESELAEFGMLGRRESPNQMDSRGLKMRRSRSNIEIIQTLPTPTESPASSASIMSPTDFQDNNSTQDTNATPEPIFKEEQGSPIYQSPLANANAPPPPRLPRSELSRKASLDMLANTFSPDYIPPSENAFPPRSQIGVRTGATRSNSGSRPNPRSKSHSTGDRDAQSPNHLFTNGASFNVPVQQLDRAATPADILRSMDQLNEDEISKDGSSSGATTPGAGKRFGLRSLVQTLTKR